MPRQVLPTRVNLATTHSRVIRNAIIAKNQRQAMLHRMRQIPRPFARQYGHGLQECKFYDSQTTQGDLIDTGVFWHLNNVQVGAGAFNRIGRQIQNKAVHLKMNIRQKNGALNGSNIRWMLIYDRQTNGALPANTAILSNDVPAQLWIQKPKNMDNRDRFLILRDQQVMVNTLTQENSIAHIDAYVKLNLPTTFNAGANADIRDTATGSLILAIFDTQPLGLINCQIDLSARLYFFDK